MKIISRVGERLLPYWNKDYLRSVLAFTGTGSALWTGSCELARRGWAKAGEHLTTTERLGTLAFGGYVAVFGCAQAPHIARFAIPGTLVAWCVAAWWAAPGAIGKTVGEPATDEPDGPDPQDVTDLVRDLIGDDTGVLLTRLRPPLRAADTRAVRALLAAADITVRPGVRTTAGNGPGVHRDDVPAPPPTPAAPSPEGVVAGEDANTNTNNALRVDAQEGMTIIYDPADRHRTHSLKKAR